MCYCSKGLDLLRRTLCLFLCVVLLVCFFLVPRAHAVVAEAELAYWGGAIVVSVLAAGGMALATGDAQKVGSAMYAALKDTGGKAWDSIQSMAAWAASAGSKVKDAAFRVGADVWQAITDCFNKSYSNGTFFYTGVSSSIDVWSAEDAKDYLNGKRLTSAEFTDAEGIVHRVFVSYNGKVWYGYHYKGDTLVHRSDPVSGLSSDTAFLRFYYAEPSTSALEFYISVMRDGNVIGSSSWYRFLYIPTDGTPVKVNQSIPYTAGVALPAPDLKYPGDNYLVKAPDLPSVDTATGAVSWPSDAVFNKDAIAVPYPIDAAGQKVADIPFDVPVDQTTGKDITADTGTDVKPDVKPGEGTDTDTDTDVKWPTDTDLSLPKLIITKFPFCIPFDVARLIGLLEAQPKAPIFKVPLKYGSVMDEEITLDLSQFSDAIRIVRWGELILFVAGLAYVTRNYIKW